MAVSNVEQWGVGRQAGEGIFFTVLLPCTRGSKTGGHLTVSGPHPHCGQDK